MSRFTVLVVAMGNENTKVHKPRRRHNACREMNCHSEWVRSRVVRRAPGELANSKSVSGQLSPRSRRMERSVYKFFVHRTLSINYASKAVLSNKSDWTLNRCRADIASAAKSSFFAITFDPNAFSEIHKSKTF